MTQNVFWFIQGKVKYVDYLSCFSQLESIETLDVSRPNAGRMNRWLRDVKRYRNDLYVAHRIRDIDRCFSFFLVKVVHRTDGPIRLRIQRDDIYLENDRKRERETNVTLLTLFLSVPSNGLDYYIYVRSFCFFVSRLSIVLYIMTSLSCSLTTYDDMKMNVQRY